MWFKNLLFYRLTNWALDAAGLEAALSEHALQACSGLEMQSRGWLPPKGDGEPLVHAQGKQLLIALGVEKKLLPATVINQFAKARAVEIEEQQGYKPGRKQLKQIKEAVADELLPRAFAMRRSTCVWIDPEDGWMVVDAASIAKADEVVEMLLKAVPDARFAAVRTQSSPVTAMTGWLAGDEAPAGFTIDRDCELRGTGEEKATVRYVRHALDAAEIGQHIAAGKEVSRLALTWADRFSFVLYENLQVKRLAPLDFIKEQGEGADDVFDSDFALMTGELRKLLPDLVAALGGEQQG